MVGVEVDFRRNGLRRIDWIRRHQVMVHPLLLDMSIHHFDLLRLVLGREAEWVDVTAIRTPSSGYGDPPAAYGTLGFGGGTVASYRGNWISSGRRTPWAGQWRIEGSTGGIEWTSRGDPGVRDALRLRTPGGAARPVALPSISALDRAGAIVEFASAIRRGVEPQTSARRNLATLALTLGAIRSAVEGRRVEAAEFLGDLPEDLR